MTDHIHTHPVELDQPWVGGGTEAAVWSPHLGNCLSQEKHLRLRVKQLICGNLNGMRIRQSLQQQTGTGALKGATTGSWSLGIVEQSQGEGCYWLWRDGLRGCEGGDCREKCLWKKDSHRSKAILLSHALGGGAITIASLPSQVSNGSWTTERHWTTE